MNSIVEWRPWHWRREILIAAVAVASVLLSTLLNFSSFRLHLAELQWYFQKSEILDGNMSHVHMVAKYENQRKLFLNRIERTQVDEAEFDLVVNLDNRAARLSRMMTGSAIDKLSLWLINGLRRLTDKPTLPSEAQVRTLERIEDAYRLERAKEYHRALMLYESLLPQAYDPRLRGIIWLHQGFCLAMLGKDDAARALYLQVREFHRDSDLGVVATLLLQHMELILREQDRIQRANYDALAKARKLSELLRCTEALRQFDSLEVVLPEAQAQIQMLRGTCLEQIGAKAQAAKSYLKAIRTAGRGSLAQDANRRLFVMGTQVAHSTQPSDGEKLRENAATLDQHLADHSLRKMHSRVITPPEPLPEEDLSTRAASLGPGEVLRPTLTRAELQGINAQVAEVQQTLVDTVRSSDMGRTRGLSGLPPVGSRTQILLKNGKTFRGEVLSEASATVIRLQTMIGIIGIPQRDIARILPP